MTDDILFPKVITAYQGPLSTFEASILEQGSKIESWFDQQWKLTPPLVTTSVDLRYAGYKIAPVDTNLFPAGFNNLHPSMLALCTQALQKYILNLLPTCQRILILPENHTRNIFYLENLAIIKRCLIEGGFKVHIGSLNPEVKETVHLELSQGILSIEPLTRNQDLLFVGEYKPCLVLLNHDLSSGIPDILQSLQQPICPATALGWGERLKSKHFHYFQQVVDEFSSFFSLQSESLKALFDFVDDVEFMQQRGLERLAQTTDRLLNLIQQTYRQVDIDQTPFVTVKTDNGTYGMGIMMVDRGEVFLNLSRKQRTHMASRKGGEKVTRLLVQEGIPTIETIDSHVAEPVVYMIGDKVIGGFYRVNPTQSSKSNLNSSGMYFKPMNYEGLEPYDKQRSTTSEHRFYVYGVIARLAALAAARESAALLPTI